MSLPLLIIAALAPVAGPPITVTGHAWAPFISPMGEPFRPRSASDDTLADWFAQADRNRDGVLTADEMLADAERFFATLDSNGDGEIDPDELSRYEYEVAPDIQVNAKTRRTPQQPAPAATPTESEGLYSSDNNGRRQRRERAAETAASLGIDGALQGAARYSLLDIPEPVAAADTDFNRAITREEFRAAALARFQLLYSSSHSGRLTLTSLEALLPNLGGTKARHRSHEVDTRLGNPLPSGP